MIDFAAPADTEPLEAPDGRMRVKVASGLSGYFLAKQLDSYGARVVGDEARGWAVEVPVDFPAPDVISRVRRWLVQESLPSANVVVGTARFSVIGAPAGR